MPIYDFACSACGHSFERLQKMSDADPTICPECGLETVSKQVTAPSFRLAGSGWYETDFKKDGDKKKNLVDSKTSTDKPMADKPTTPAPAKTPAAKTE
jgi:putative FmdB family regulatory protein